MVWRVARGAWRGMPSYKELRRSCLKPCAIHYWAARGAGFQYESCIAECVKKKKAYVEHVKELYTQRRL